jgi:predicted TIM-barrel fold metal-dependent hydrolase
MAFKVIDIHPHVISTDEAKYPRAPLGGHQSVWSKERPVSAEEMIRAMDEAGVEKSAVVQASTCYGHDNSYLADSIDRYPKRFTGVCSVDVLADNGPERIRYWNSRALRGLRLFTVGSTMTTQSTWLDDPRSFPSWETVRELGWPMCLQVRVPGLPMVKTLLDRFPDVRVLIDHLAGAEVDDGPPYAKAAPLFELAKYPNVFLKLTSNSVRAAKKGAATPETYFAKVIGEFGSNRIAWGSNFPASAGTLKEIVDESRAALAFLSEQDQLNIFRRTAQKLYPALAD